MSSTYATAFGVEVVRANASCIDGSEGRDVESQNPFMSATDRNNRVADLIIAGERLMQENLRLRDLLATTGRDHAQALEGQPDDVVGQRRCWLPQAMTVEAVA